MHIFKTRQILNSTCTRILYRAGNEMRLKKWDKVLKQNETFSTIFRFLVSFLKKKKKKTFMNVYEM